MYTEAEHTLAAREKLLAYNGYPDDDDAESLLLQENQPYISSICLKRFHPRLCFSQRYLPWILHTVGILICSALVLHANNILKKSHRGCIEKFNAWSPLLDAIDSEPQDVRFDYSLWYQSPTKGPPTPQVEQAWYELMQYGEIAVPSSTILRIGHNLSAVQYPPEVPGAAGQYPVIASGTHGIHCLHYIWQDHYVEQLPDVQANRAAIPEMYERHYEHCVDYIRQFLMCKFDTTLIPLNWVRTHQNPTPNGNTLHKCVNWGRLQDWLKDRAVEMPEGFRWRQPENAMALDRNP